jgi:hypothetical protein
VLKNSDVLDLIKSELFPGWEKERDRLDRIDRWYRIEQDPIKLPRTATAELKQLAELSKVPWLGLVVTTVAQCLYVNGYRTETDQGGGDLPTGEVTAPPGPWRTWQANRFDHRQIAVHRAALAYGYSFVRVLPGLNDAKVPTSVMRGVSPRKAWAVYADPAEDDWPMYVLEVDCQPNKSYMLKLYDEETVYTVGMESLGAVPEMIEVGPHGSPECPFVRYSNQLDLEGRTDGEVDPFIPMAARINKTSYDRLLTQHFSSWKVRTVAGMAEPDDEEDSRRRKLRIRQDDILVAEDADTKFGTLDETPLGGFIDAHKADVEVLAAVTQTPTFALTGDLINLSADALAAARAQLTQKAAERQMSFGESHGQTLRLAAAQEGNAVDAQDIMARPTWADMEIRSMSQAVDALGKAATMLQVPYEALWARIPGVNRTDVREWRELALSNDPMVALQRELARQTQRSAEQEAADG